ncbi:MAG: hypothetical protein AAGJ54_07015 [Planctomycetota bacterium]
MADAAQNTVTNTVHIRAHAKLNLALSVGTPIPEGEPGAGMHPIASWMVPLALADELAYTPREDGAGVELDRSWAEDAPRNAALGWLPESDLCVRAVDRLGAAVDRRLGVSIDLVKRIPVGGGLGGGSSDAAATLIAANRAHDLGLPLERLAEIGAGLGSDVPYFIDEHAANGHSPAPALVTGLGERIERVTTPPVAVVLCVPEFGCDTAAVYRALDDAPVTLDEAAVAKLAASGDARSAELFNDLFEPARRVEPELAELWRQIGRASKQPVHLSGSGSTMFIVADDEAHAESLAASLALHVPGVAFVPTSTEDPSQ